MMPEEYGPQPDGATLRALARTSRELAAEPDPIAALWRLVGALRENLRIDRGGIFAYDPASLTLVRVVGVDRHGEPEYGGQDYVIERGDHPLHQVARREIPYYFSDDAPRDFPHCCFAPGVRAHAIIPIVAGQEFLGTLCVDNCLSGRSIPEIFLEPLFLCAGLAALPLFALYQQRERDRVDAMRRHIHREVLYSVTGGKVRLCEAQEIAGEWPPALDPLPIRREMDVRNVREAAREAALRAGMVPDRVADFALCVSEAVTNALLHGSGGVAAIGVRDGRLRVRVQDYGDGIAPENLSRATLLKGWSSRASMGLGFTVINETADRVYLHTGPAGTTVIVEMAVEPRVNLPDECNPLMWGEAIAL